MKRHPYNQVVFKWHFGNHHAPLVINYLNGVPCYMYELIIRTDTFPSKYAYIEINLGSSGIFYKRDPDSMSIRQLLMAINRNAVEFDEPQDNGNIKIGFSLQRGEEFCEAALKIAKKVFEVLLKQPKQTIPMFDLWMNTYVKVGHGWKALSMTLAEKHGFLSL